MLRCAQHDRYPVSSAGYQGRAVRQRLSALERRQISADAQQLPDMHAHPVCVSGFPRHRFAVHQRLQQLPKGFNGKASLM